MFYWTRGNDSVKGLNTLRLAQYSVESYYTSVSEAVYETGNIFELSGFPLHVRIHPMAAASGAQMHHRIV